MEKKCVGILHRVGQESSMASLRRRAPRLFTGAIFPEEIGHGLMAFARRHNLMSDVWVPKRLVGRLKSGVTLLPNAILCDVSLMPGCGSTDLQVVGFDRVLVNAAHTTDAEYFERYQSAIVSGTRGSLPLTPTGVLYNESRSTEFASVSEEQGFRSPYWVRLKGRRRRWINAEETPYPGRYNPTECVLYEPHTFTNLPFPPAIALLMRRKASKFGYTSRTWVTMREGELHGTCLDAGRKRDGAPIFVAHFSGKGQVRAVEYFCADQFEDHTVFPTTREIDLAASGVFVGADKVRSYPLLASFASESAAASRHQRIGEETAKFSAPLLLNVSHSATVPKLNSDMQEALRKYSLLRGFSSPYFVIHTAEVGRYLRLKPQEQGIVLPTGPTDIDALSSAHKSCCLFNVEQFEEETVVKEMVARTPMHFLIQMPIRGALLVECARAQSVRSRCSQMWIPERALGYIGSAWNISPRAASVPKENGLNAPAPLFYNTCDVSIPEEALKWWPTYFPHDVHHKLYSGEIKMLLSMRAWEQQYKSSLWVTQALVTRLGATRRRPSLRNTFLTGKPFEKKPAVLVGDDEFINFEEIKEAGLFALDVKSGKKQLFSEKG
ncbi:hypothetical protein DQ04_00621110 [Trypanosoma grayi]|uniref:hypothetical protein n=1 Tax=Trypanosoma grayi TaxID=71804 RepID=UPI0004F43783|nr:hypothetical protein DQ04_00621110 [Trypanosoma grayi]KEG14102.1 hypothetical protein DQ04_00621110 [Trypanosoma grayi]